MLSKLARDVLVVPVSTIASESAFGTGGHILDPFRSSLSPLMVQNLVCAQDWLQALVPISFRKSKDELEALEDEWDKTYFRPYIFTRFPLWSLTFFFTAFSPCLKKHLLF